MEFAKSIDLEGTELQKVGEGSYRWLFIKVYDGALYLDSQNPKADPLGKDARRLELAYAVSISDDDFRKSGNKILRENLTQREWDSIQDRLPSLNAAYRSVKKGDRYALTYLPGRGTTLSFNDHPLVTIPGEDFAAAYFSIWLGDHPAKESFRRDLLTEN